MNLLFRKRSSSDFTFFLVNDREEVDFNYLSCEYHIHLNIGVSLAICESKKQKCEILLLGLGGGVLATLIHKFFKEVQYLRIMY